MDRIAAHEHNVTQRILDGLSQMDGIRVLGPTDMHLRGGAVAFEVAGVHPHDVGQILDSYDVAVRVGHHCAIPLHRFFGVKSSSRASVSLTTTDAEVDQFLRGLESVQQFFGGIE